MRTQRRRPIGYQLERPLPEPWQRVSVFSRVGRKVSSCQHGVPLPATCARPLPTSPTTPASYLSERTPQ